MSEVESVEKAGALAEALLSRNGALAGTFRRVLELSQGTAHLLVVVDQFEEMFTLASADDDDLKDEKARKEAEDRRRKRASFLEDLLACPDSAPVTIVLTIRADYYSRATNASRRWKGQNAVAKAQDEPHSTIEK